MLSMLSSSKKYRPAQTLLKLPPSLAHYRRVVYIHYFYFIISVLDLASAGDLNELLNCGTTDICGQIILWCVCRREREWAVLHCRMFYSIPDFYPLGANSTPFPSCDNQTYQDIAKCPFSAKIITS